MPAFIARYWDFSMTHNTTLDEFRDTDETDRDSPSGPSSHLGDEHHTWFAKVLRHLDFSDEEYAAHRSVLVDTPPEDRWIRLDDIELGDT